MRAPSAAAPATSPPIVEASIPWPAHLAIAVFAQALADARSATLPRRIRDQAIDFLLESDGLEPWAHLLGVDIDRVRGYARRALHATGPIIPVIHRVARRPRAKRPAATSAGAAAPWPAWPRLAPGVVNDAPGASEAATARSGCTSAPWMTRAV